MKIFSWDENHFSLCFLSDNVERREIEKERLQHELRECDDKLDRQVEGEIQDNINQYKATVHFFT